MENVITLGKLIVLLFLFCLPLLSIFYENSENKRNDLTRPVMGTIFLVYNWRASEASETLFSHVYENSRYIYVYMYVCF